MSISGFRSYLAKEKGGGDHSPPLGRMRQGGLIVSRAMKPSAESQSTHGLQEEPQPWIQ